VLELWSVAMLAAVVVGTLLGSVSGWCGMALILRKAQGNRPGDWNEDDYDVMSGRMTVGRIYRRTGSPPNAPTWTWVIQNVHAGCQGGAGEELAEVVGLGRADGSARQPAATEFADLDGKRADERSRYISAVRVGSRRWEGAASKSSKP
jgi:hypothetical protein